MHNAPGGVQSIRNPQSAARLVLLVTASVFINYIDRGNLATAAPLMQDELHLSASQLGVLLSAFYCGYVVCMPGMGWLAERWIRVGRSPTLVYKSIMAANHIAAIACMAGMVMLPAALAGNPLSAGTPAQFTGFVTPFGTAPPDFNAITTVNYANTSAQLWLGWGWQSGYAMPFSTLTGTGLLISPSALKASNVHVIRIGFETIDPSTLAGGLQLVPDPAATNPQFIVGHLQSWKVDNYSTFGDFTAALMMDLTGSTAVLQLGARGPYATATGIMHVDDMAVLLSD